MKIKTISYPKLFTKELVLLVGYSPPKELQLLVGI
jgi:hypothetical protein